MEGSLSILKKTQYQNTIKQDLTHTQSDTVPVELVYDGKILHKNFSKQNTYDDTWFMNEIKKGTLPFWISRMLS
ncbi:YetF domain-containing protein [Niallia sp. Krafla_26]|uniref:YetF domain-containing protein n=1 Tax=Niallia sp. Krafla_26 TaxID=3064703 RepID=UPI003D1722DB